MIGFFVLPLILKTQLFNKIIYKKDEKLYNADFYLFVDVNNMVVRYYERIHKEQT